MSQVLSVFGINQGPSRREKRLLEQQRVEQAALARKTQDAQREENLKKGRSSATRRSRTGAGGRLTLFESLTGVPSKRSLGSKGS